MHQVRYYCSRELPLHFSEKEHVVVFLIHEIEYHQRYLRREA